MSDNITPIHAFPSGSPAPAQPPEMAMYVHPDDVARDSRLAQAEKRAILAAWISDARAVENAPALRRLDSGAVANVDTILRVLRALDDPAPEGGKERRRVASSRQRRAVPRWLKRMTLPKKSNDDDDEPPPAPAGVAIPFRPNFVVADGAAPDLPGMAAVYGRAA